MAGCSEPAAQHFVAPDRTLRCDVASVDIVEELLLGPALLHINAAESSQSLLLLYLRSVNSRGLDGDFSSRALTCTWPRVLNQILALALFWRNSLEFLLCTSAAPGT